MLHGRFTTAAFEMPFCEDVLDAAHGVIAHSRYVLDRVAALRPDLPTAHVPMGVPLPPLIPRAAARARLGLPADALILASFGHINPYKRLEAVLRALRALRADHASLRYLLVGSVSPSYDVHAVIARAGLADLVTVTGYVDRATFEDYVAAADICLNLRHPTAGETSASLLRLLGAGRPTLVTASGSFAEFPPDVAAQVDPDTSEVDLILAYCRLLTARPDLAAALGANARAYVARAHTLAGAAAGYIRFLAQRYGWGTLPRLRDRPLWEPRPALAHSPGIGHRQPPALERSEKPTAAEKRTDAQEQGRGHKAATDRLTEGGSAPNAQPSAFSFQLSALNASVAEALADLGATEDDAPLLNGAAQALTDLLGPERTP